MEKQQEINPHLNALRTNPTANQMQTDKFITHSEDKIFFRTWKSDSQRKIIIGIHGMAAHSEYYVQVADQVVQEGVTLIAIDLKHHGHSSGKKGDLESFEQISVHIQEFITSVRQKYLDTPIYLMGISMGGVIAINFSVDHPELIDGLILIAPGVKTEFKLSLGEILKIPLLLMAFLFKKGKPVIKIGERSERGTRNPLRIAYQEQDNLRIQVVSPRYLLGLVKWKKRAFQNAEKVTQPVIIFIGTEDQLVSFEGVKEFFSYLTVDDKLLVELEGAYHSLFSDPAMDEIGWEKLREWIRSR